MPETFQTNRQSHQTLSQVRKSFLFEMRRISATFKRIRRAGLKGETVQGTFKMPPISTLPQYKFDDCIIIVRIFSYFLMK